MIRIVKLVTGEEVIGDITSDGEYIIKQPCIVQMGLSRSDPTTPSISLIPYAFYVENHTIRVASKDIIWNSKPIDEVYNQYNRIFGTGIQLAGVQYMYASEYKKQYTGMICRALGDVDGDSIDQAASQLMFAIKDLSLIHI